MRRNSLSLAVLAFAALAAVVAWTNSRSPAQPPAQDPPASATVTPASDAPDPLPLTQVYLFSSGVGYFQREGTIDGEARIDLRFPATDVNDLLKSLVLQDADQGRISVVSYDSQEPVERTLRSYALDLTYNPTFGQLLNQARGEKIEVVASTGTMTGVIMGLETRPHGTPPTETDYLNLVCSDGVRSFPLSQVQRMRFLNSSLDTEFRKALEILAGSRDSLKRTVSLSFQGEGKRKARVGYVVENPMWKASYRLVLRDAQKGSSIQGWAIVENTTDEDWKGVRAALISGRPISFQMDLYQPLYVPRPTVEPERFASLRPPTYNAALVSGQQMGQNFGVGGALGQFAQFGQLGQFGNFGFQGNPFGNRYQQPGNFGPQFGLQGFNPMLNPQQGQVNPQDPNNQANPVFSNRLTWDQVQERRRKQQEVRDQAKQIGSTLALGAEGVAALAEEGGEAFQYHIEEKLTLPRQKSAMLPIVSKPITASRVSIYNEAVHARFPLLGVRFKNTTGLTLSQGPMAIYDGTTYAGDARLMDMQPDEERFVSYALDLGSEVKAHWPAATEQLVSAKVDKGVLHVSHRVRHTKVYVIANRSKQERQVVIEHPTRPGAKLIEPDKALEQTRDSYRFQRAVAPGKTEKVTIVEEMTRPVQMALLSDNEAQLRLLAADEATPAKVKAVLEKVIDYRVRLARLKDEAETIRHKLKLITEDQQRLRSNLDRVPKESAAARRYLDKLDKQETELEKLQDGLVEKTEAERDLQREMTEHVRTLSAE